VTIVELYIPLSLHYAHFTQFLLTRLLNYSENVMDSFAAVNHDHLKWLVVKINPMSSAYIVM